MPVPDDESAGSVEVAQAGPAAGGSAARPRIADSNDPNSADWRGQELVLPDGRTIPDDDEKESRSPTRTVMTPVLNLDEVAAAGRRAAAELRRPAVSPADLAAKMPNFLLDAFAHAGTGGQFDYQRHHEGNQVLDLIGDKLGIPGLYEQRRQFLPIANINVGLYSQQSGLSLDETLSRAGLFARFASGNARPDQPHGLDKRTAHFIQEGYKLGESGMFGRALP